MSMHPSLALAYEYVYTNALVCALALAMAYAGSMYGLFLATVAVLAVLTGIGAGLALSPRMVAVLAALGWPPEVLLPVCYFLICACILGSVKVLVGHLCREDDVWLVPWADRFGGALMGSLAGVLLGGAVLIGWSMCELPPGVRAESPQPSHDFGTHALRVFAMLVEPDQDGQSLLLGGDALREKTDSGREIVYATEPFEDADEDGKRGESERFLDYDNDGRFTVNQAVTDHAHGRATVRDVGLLDRYWLSAWRRMRVLHPPRISSVGLDVTSQVAGKGEMVYTSIVKDPDPNHESQLKYSLKAGKEDDSELLTIDMATGVVKFREDCGVVIDPDLREVHFTLIVEDPSGLTDEKDLEVKLRPPQMQSQESGTQAQP